MKEWEITIRLRVAEIWVEDGFNMSDPSRIKQLQEHLEQKLIPQAFAHEVHADITVKEKSK